MWLIAWERCCGHFACYDVHNEKLWEVVSGEDAMQIRVDEIVKGGIHVNDIVVGKLMNLENE
jgi:hypothetical protein